MGLFDRGGGGGLFGGTPNPYQMPQVPWGQNPMITTAALGLLGGRTLNEGLQNVAQLAPAGLAAKTAMQRDMYTIQQTQADRARKSAAFNAGFKKMNGQTLTPQEEADFAADPDVALKIFELTQTKPTDDTSEYRFAQSQGFKGSFEDWQIKMRQAGAQRSVGTPQPGWRIVYDAAGNPVSQEPIPGSEADLEQKAAAGREQTGAESQAVKAETILDATTSIKDEIEGATLPAVGTNSRAFGWHSGTAAGRVRSYVGTLKSGVALQAVLKLKEASSTGATGFGALSAPELQLLVDDIGSLDPDNTESDIFLRTIDRIESRWQTILNDVERTVPPERLKEMGIDIEALRGGAGGGGGDSPDPLGIR